MDAFLQFLTCVKVSVRYLRRGIVLNYSVKVYFGSTQINFDFSALALTWDQLLCQTHPQSSVSQTGE